VWASGTRHRDKRPLAGEALAFTVILLAAGTWSSRRAPWKGIPGRKGALTAFALTLLPFSLVEVAVGVVSLFTGLRSIPPVLAIGTAVDSAILVAGLAVAAYRGGGARPLDSGTAA
jgi:heme A synthase